jgi:hypothetical protein
MLRNFLILTIAFNWLAALPTGKNPAAKKPASNPASAPVGKRPSLTASVANGTGLKMLVAAADFAI